jgi:hypothetical protein
LPLTVYIYSEDLLNSDEELRQPIRNAVASSTIEEVPNSLRNFNTYRIKLYAEKGGELIE